MIQTNQSIEFGVKLMNNSGYEIQSEDVISQLLSRLSALELENASLRVAINQLNKEKSTDDDEEVSV